MVGNKSFFLNTDIVSVTGAQGCMRGVHEGGSWPGYVVGSARWSVSPLSLGLLQGAQSLIAMKLSVVHSHKFVLFDFTS